MSYQALARRWRPRAFDQVVGQQHVVSALAHALDHDRVHHAFLFTGTRGVGKTTLARLLAKALNCELGVSSTPCGKCAACIGVDEGRFVDLIEVDAASRTKVEQTRELLDNVQYTPTQGRYKVYLIDEVHMLSPSSFNALLKTLEEPPTHVKFLLATTNPQKVPATILSRCLQFHLQLLDIDQIVPQFEKILAAEQVEFEADALVLLARAAAGSLRDGLSLLDQALAHGGGALAASGVRDMLGTIDQDQVRELLAGLASGDAPRLLACAASMAQHSIDYSTALDELLTALHRISVCQSVAEAVPEGALTSENISQFAARIAPEDVQLYYQIGLIGKRDLSLAPDRRTGFEMTLLRMLAFRPVAAGSTVAAGGTERNQPSARSTAAAAEPAAPVQPRSQGAMPGKATADPEALLADAEQWADLIANLSVGGLLRELAMNMAPRAWDDEVMSVVLDPSHRHLHTVERQRGLETVISEALGRSVRLRFEFGDREDGSPRDARMRRDRETVEEARATLEADPNVREMVERFNATIIPESIEPAGDEANHR